MASHNPQGSASKSFTVVAHSDPRKRVGVMQFPTDQGFDKTGHVSLARENNFKEYKSAYNIDAMPTTGAGSEFGREAKEEARRRKFGYIRKKYNSHAQPWLMQIGAKKDSKKFKGTRNGGILENASYFIFTKTKDGTFEATPVEEWYNFKSMVSYNNLNAEEAEEEFARRDKNLNMFNIMVRKRIKNEVEGGEDDKEKVKKDVKSKGLMLTEMEDWADLSDEDGDPAADGNNSDSSITGTNVKGRGKGKGKKKKKDKDTDDEAVEDSDDGDMEAKQVDYMSDTSDSDSDMEGRAVKSKYEEKGVEDEDGLRDIVVESDNEKDNKEEDKKDKDSGASSDSSESESDDPDRKDDEFTKAFLMTGSKKDRGKSPVPRSTTPIPEDKKRKLQSSPRSGSPASKKIKQEPAVATNVKPLAASGNEARPATPITSAASSSREGLTEESVRRYLLRKPMSSKDLFKLFKSKKLGLSNEEIVTRITNIMKKLKTNQQRINGIMHFSISE